MAESIRKFKTKIESIYYQRKKKRALGEWWLYNGIRSNKRKPSDRKALIGFGWKQIGALGSLLHGRFWCRDATLLPTRRPLNGCVADYALSEYYAFSPPSFRKMGRNIENFKWGLVFIVCLTIVTLILIATFRPHSAGLHQAIESIYWVELICTTIFSVFPTEGFPSVTLRTRVWNWSQYINYLNAMKLVLCLIVECSVRLSIVRLCSIV